MDCIPPWLSSSNQCYKKITIYNTSRSAITDMISERYQFPKFDRRPTEAETKCQNPCKKMTNRISIISEAKKSTYAVRMKFRFKKTVRVEKKIVVYTWFNFIIHVGSSLGLWLGLSALGIIDLAIKAFTVARKWKA